MRYLVREKIFTFANRFTIEDDRGYPQYEVEGKLLSIGKKLRIYDLDGQELVYIKEEIFRLLSEYMIYEKDEKMGMIKKELTFFRPKFNITSKYGNFTLDGDIFHHDFNVLRDGKPVAWINKKWISFSDTYSVEIAEGEDHPFILAIVIVLDQIFYDEN